MSNFDSLVIPSPEEYAGTGHELCTSVELFLDFVNAWNIQSDYHYIRNLAAKSLKAAGELKTLIDDEITRKKGDLYE